MAPARRRPEAAAAAGPRQDRPRASPASWCPSAAPSPTATTCSGEALHALARSGTPAAREILLSPSPSPSDRSAGNATYRRRAGDTASWTAQEQLRSAARQMLLAGALATRARAGYYGARHRRAGHARPWRTSWWAPPRANSHPHPGYLPVGTGAPPSPCASTRPSTPLVRPSTTGGPPGAPEAFDSAVRRASATS